MEHLKRPSETPDAQRSIAESLAYTRPEAEHTAAPPVQFKLSVGAPDDQYEQEADRMAEAVVSGNVQRQTMSEEKEEEKKTVQAKLEDSSVQMKEEEEEPIQAKEEHPTVQRQAAAGNTVSGETQTGIDQARGGGAPLSENVRSNMENAFQADFSGVRVHNNDNSDQLNHDLGARAFTTGSDIFFKKSEYNPESSDGQRLLAHELTHVVQQNAAQPKTKD